MDLSGAQWRKSSFSNGSDGNECVEVAFLLADGVAVRDTKDRSRGTHVFAVAEWHAFLTAIRAGEFDAH